ncbi:MAG: nuclear transport factor 2 family protein [Caulobacteraceae bacterium]
MADADTPNEALVRKFFEDLSTGDLDKLRPLLHPEATWEAMGKTIPGAGAHKGHKGILDEFLGPVRGLFKPGDPKVTVRNLVGRGDLVGAETEAHGHFANGTPYDNRYCWMVEIKDGKIFALREYMDTAYILSVVS